MAGDKKKIKEVEQSDMENASKEVTEEMDDREKTIVRVNGEDRTVYRDQAQLMRDFDDVVDMGVSATKEGSGIAVEYQVSNADAQEAVEDILGMEMEVRHASSKHDKDRNKDCCCIHGIKCDVCLSRDGYLY